MPSIATLNIYLFVCLCLCVFRWNRLDNLWQLPHHRRVGLWLHRSTDCYRSKLSGSKSACTKHTQHYLLLQMLINICDKPLSCYLFLQEACKIGQSKWQFSCCFMGTLNKGGTLKSKHTFTHQGAIVIQTPPECVFFCKNKSTNVTVHWRTELNCWDPP